MKPSVYFLMFLRPYIGKSQIYFQNHLGLRRNFFSSVLGFSKERFENFGFKFT